MTVSAEAQSARRERRRAYALIAPAALWTICFFLLPTLAIFRLSFFEKSGGKLADTPSLANYRRFMEQSYFLDSLWTTLELTAIVLVLSLLLAYPWSWRQTGSSTQRCSGSGSCQSR